MNEKRFIEIIDAYGASPRHWPQAERIAALAFAKTLAPDALVKSDLRVAEAIDALLDEAFAEPDDAVLDSAAMGRIVASFPAQGLEYRANVLPMKRPQPIRSMTGWVAANRAAAASFAAATVLGFVIGTGYPGSSANSANDAAQELVVSFALAEG